MPQWLYSLINYIDVNSSKIWIVMLSPEQYGCWIKYPCLRANLSKQKFLSPQIIVLFLVKVKERYRIGSIKLWFWVLHCKDDFSICRWFQDFQVWLLIWNPWIKENQFVDTALMSLVSLLTYLTVHSAVHTHPFY